MAIFKLIEPDHWTLKVPVDQCSTELDKEELARDLIETMKECSGLGLSATQVGVRERAFVMYKDLNKRETMACFNPHILEYSEEKVCTWKTERANNKCDIDRDKGCRITKPDIIGETTIYLLEKVNK